ncbi:MAG: iron(III) transport system permease protein [Kribbellaceae bacterium]|nr:iron(III) transport system permease protein [Kribbellaceae bacterium]
MTEIVIDDRPVEAGPSQFGPASPRGHRLRLAASRFRGGWLLAFWIIIVAILVLPILLFLLVAFSPRLFAQGPEWFTLSGFGKAFSGQLLKGIENSLFISVTTAVLSMVIGFAVAWLVLRSDVPGRRLWTGSMFAMLLAPSYLVALGWERLIEPSGVLELMGFTVTGFRNVFYGPVGVIVVLTMKGIPFAYLAISSALRGLGEEFEAAARVHGGGRLSASRMVFSLLAPAVWSALAIVFAESISDFGVAATLANDSHFPVATYVLYNAIDSFPINFPVAAAVGWILLSLAGLALLAQSRALHGRSYRVLGGRNRPARRHRLGLPVKIGATAGVALVVVIGLGVPIFGAVSASLINGLGSLIGDHKLSLDNYVRVLSGPTLGGPLLFSAELAAITATLSVILGVVVSRVLSTRTGRLSARILDLLLLTAVALPGIVFAAGYIFTYNLPVMNNLGIHLYGTSMLLLFGYVATALPSTSRVLLGTVGQVQESLGQAGRVHGGTAAGSWLQTVLPLLARPMLSAWVLTFSSTLLELPVSELLYPPNKPPVAVGITKALANYDFGGGTAMEVIALLLALAVMGLVWGLFGLLAPAGWRRLGRTT